MAEAGAPPRNRRRRGVAPEGRKHHRVKKSDTEEAEVKRLGAAIAEGRPEHGSNPLSLTAETATAGYAAARTFEELPLSNYTKEALSVNKFVELTAIQRAALPHALAGRDILGAAKTGSGKTLAFLIPLVEKLYRARWTRFDGLGALVLTPTRELALQIFQELRKVGNSHDLSAGLLIGGKSVKEEQASINRINILIATPGRLLQHMDETPGFDTSNLQMLVLDEADRLLDMGFAATLDGILDSLPKQRQTMLFSATQTKSVKDLARLSLSDPEYLAVHEASDSATPLKLQQAVAVISVDQKMDTLWSFIKSHLTSKTIVFLSTCKQVRFFHEVFRKLRPGVPLRALHGGMKQMKRMIVFQEFCQAEHMVLFATDVAGRGLDFPSVDWVVQVDCPEDTAAYIHRVGRTARYMSAGRALLMLSPHEAEGMKAALAAAKIPYKPLKINPAKQQSVGPAVQALLSKNTQLKEWGQRALVAYVRSVFLAPSKDVFDVSSLPLDALAVSWGMAAAPRMRFLKKVGGKREVVAELGADGEAEEPGQSDGSGEEEEEGGEGEQAEKRQKAAVAAPTQKLRQAKQKDAGGLDGLMGPGKRDGDGDEDDDDGFLVIKQRDVFGKEWADEAKQQAAEREAADGAASGANNGKKKKLKIKVGRSSGQRVVFDSEGNPLHPLEALATDPELVEGRNGPEDDEEVDDLGEGMHVVADESSERFARAARLMKMRDKQDKQHQKELRAQAKAERKARLRAAAAAEAGEVPEARLGRSGDDDGSGGGASDSGDEYVGGESGPNDQDLRGGASDSDGSDGGGDDDDDDDEDMGRGGKPQHQIGGGGGKGMATTSAKGAAKRAGEPLNKKPSAKKSKGQNAPLSIAEQEAAVLARIAAKRS